MPRKDPGPATHTSPSGATSMGAALRGPLAGPGREAAARGRPADFPSGRFGASADG